MKKIFLTSLISCFMLLLLFVLTGCSTSNTANIILSKENYKETTEKYAEENKDSDDLVYFAYATSNYIFKDGLANAFNMEMTEDQKETESYKNIYGKTINQLVQEGKNLMKENNMTVEKYKETLQNLSNSINTFNKTMSSGGGE